MEMIFKKVMGWSGFGEIPPFRFPGRPIGPKKKLFPFDLPIDYSVELDDFTKIFRPRVPMVLIFKKVMIGSA